MPNVPLVTATVKITSKDINGNSVAKQFNSVLALNFDYAKGMLNVVDATGSFYFNIDGISPLTSIVFSITTGVSGATVVTMS